MLPRPISLIFLITVSATLTKMSSFPWQMMPKRGEKILMELSLLLGIPLSSIDINARFRRVLQKDDCISFWDVSGMYIQLRQDEIGFK